MADWCFQKGVIVQGKLHAVHSNVLNVHACVFARCHNEKDRESCQEYLVMGVCEDQLLSEQERRYSNTQHQETHLENTSRTALDTRVNGVAQHNSPIPQQHQI